MYTCLTGVPALFDKQANSVFQNTAKLDLINLGTIFKKWVMNINI